METVTVNRFAGGKPAGGRLRVGAISAHGAMGTKASIPNRFETVLNTGVRENNAFGRRTYRFDEPENELPGPGAYAKPRSSVLKPKINFSKKGSAAFASAHKAGFSEDSPMIPTPGPGAYNREDGATAKPKSAHPSPAFAAPSPKPIVAVKKAKTVGPGPGSYVLPDSWTKVPCAAGVSRAVRDTFDLVDRSAPGPGEFQRMEDLDSCKVRDKTRVSAFNASSTSRFESKKTKLAPLPPSLTSRVGATNELLVDILEEKRAAQQVRENLHATAAGHSPTVMQKIPKPTSAFAESNLDRFGSPTTRFSAQEPPDVGPGSYTKEEKPRRLLISSSWALSSVPRSGVTTDRYKPPGPAYYNPAFPTGKQSHHVPSAAYWS